MSKRNVRSIPFFPFSLAVYPVLNLFASNVGYAMFRWTIPIGAITAGAAGALLIGGYFLLRDWGRAAVFAGIGILFFFSYGAAFSIFDHILTPIGIIGRNRYLMPLYFLSFFTGGWILLRKSRSWRNEILPLNAVSLILVMLPIMRIIGNRIQTSTVGDSLPEMSSVSPQPPHRDIYYVILDGYARRDVLQDCYEFDNSEFVDYLQNRGFHVLRHSQSNYALTMLSLSSILNMDYINESLERINGEAAKTKFLANRIENNLVEHTLKRLGYTIVRMPSGFPFTHVSRYVDINYGANIIPGDFIAMLARTTLARPLIQNGFLLPHLSRAQFLEVFDRISTVPNRPGPTFTFAHIVSPHPPYQFDANGNPASASANQGDPWMNKTAYIEQMKFLNHKIENTLDSIFENSTIPPIIIIQGDHGPICTPDSSLDSDKYMRYRFSNLSAFYLPGVTDFTRYDAMTSVNTFRVVFNAYFGANIHLLEDKSFFSHWQKPFDFQPLPPLPQASP